MSDIEALAAKANAWISSKEGQAQLREAFATAMAITDKHSKTQIVPAYMLYEPFTI